MKIKQISFKEYLKLYIKNCIYGIQYDREKDKFYVMEYFIKKKLYPLYKNNKKKTKKSLLKITKKNLKLKILI